jgi:hypothetical protein
MTSDITEHDNRKKNEKATKHEKNLTKSENN